MTCNIQNSRYTLPVTSKKGVIGISVPSDLRHIAATTFSLCGFLFCASSFGGSLGGLQSPLVSAPQVAQYANPIESPPVISVVGGGFSNRNLWSPIMESPSAAAQSLSAFSTETTYQLYACSAIADSIKAQLFVLSESQGINPFELCITKITYVTQALIEKIDALASDVDTKLFNFERGLV